MKLMCGRRSLDLSRPQIMGILNTTPDSFSDGGSYYAGGELSLDLVLRRAEQMQADGATIIDVGGESTRPGAAQVGLEREMSRVVPVVEVLVRELDMLVSVDTSSPEVMRAAAAAGAGLLNDVRALRREGALAAAVDSGLPVCLMHMQGQPDSMQQKPRYDDVLAEVNEFFRERIDACLTAGLKKEQLLLDPGFGFGKSLAHNLVLLQGLPELACREFPLLVGLSRKSMIGALLGRDVDRRLAGSLALAREALGRGAAILRVHDVAETADILNVYLALQDLADS